jgi:hypothetical protein
MVFNPKKKLVEEYQNLIDILQKVWARFFKKHIGVAYNLECALYQNKLSGMNTIRTSSSISLNTINIS